MVLLSSRFDFGNRFRCASGAPDRSRLNFAYFIKGNDAPASTIGGDRFVVGQARFF